MYRMNESEFMQYEVAGSRLQDLRKKHAMEIQRVYDDIHPTRSGFDYDTGKIHAESINTEDYAIYLIELKEEHAQHEKWWKLRAEAYSEACERLTGEERSCLNKYEYGKYQERQRVCHILREYLAEIIETRPELQRKYVSLDSFDDVEEADQKIEQMSDEELLEDYQDFVGELVEEKPEEKTFESNQKKKESIFGVSTYFLSSEELEEYRSGQNGGSKWCSYEDYKGMKNSGMTDKEIALKLRIEPSMLSKRVKTWKRYGFKHKNISV